VYQLPVPWPGEYEVNLYFAETCLCATEPGQRVFDVELEGELAASVDIVTEAGWLRPHTVRLSSPVIDGSLTLELLGVVRNPVLSGVEVIGPIDFTSGNVDGARYRQKSHASVLGVMGDGTNRMNIDLLAITSITTTNKKTFDLAHTSTGELHRLDLRFGTAYESDASVRLFRIDVLHAEFSFPLFETHCAEKCAELVECSGIFVRSLQTTYHCNGISAFGRPVGTRSISTSWRLMGATDDGFTGNSGSQLYARQPNLMSLVRSSNIEGSHFAEIFQGRTVTNPSGPFLTLSTRLQRFHHLFALPISPEGCINHCASITGCVAVIIWIENEEEEDDENIMCLGVNDKGTKGGIEVDLNSISLRITDDAHSHATTRSGTGAADLDDAFFGTLNFGADKTSTSGTMVAGIIVGFIVLVALVGVFRLLYRRRRAKAEAVDKMMLMNSKGMMAGTVLQFEPLEPRPIVIHRSSSSHSMVTTPRVNPLSAAPSILSTPDLAAMGRNARASFHKMKLQLKPPSTDKPGVVVVVAVAVAGAGAGTKIFQPKPQDPIFSSRSDKVPPMRRRGGTILNLDSVEPVYPDKQTNGPIGFPAPPILSPLNRTHTSPKVGYKAESGKNSPSFSKTLAIVEEVEDVSEDATYERNAPAFFKTLAVVVGGEGATYERNAPAFF
jgi:hypothetical protein